MDWLGDFLDSLPMREYAERGDSTSLWAEPLNALTALLFIVAVAIFWRDLKRASHTSPGLRALMLLGIIHGFGSFAYHTARSPVTLLFDFVPMTSFVAVAIIFVLRHLSGRWLTAFALIGGLIGGHVIMGFTVPKDFLNGSYRHGFNVLALAGLLLWIRRSRYSTALRLTVITVVTYALGVVSRSIDQSVADAFPYGTHFLWHTFTAVSSYFAMRLVLEMQLLLRRSVGRGRGRLEHANREVEEVGLGDDAD